MKNRTEFLTPRGRRAAWFSAVVAGCAGAVVWLVFLAGAAVLTWQAVLG